MITVDEFMARFPEFDLTDYTGVTPVTNDPQEALIESMISGAEVQVDRSLFTVPGQADEAVLYLTAHLLARALPSVNARLQKSRGDDKLHTGEDVYWPVFERLARAVTFGFRST